MRSQGHPQPGKYLKKYEDLNSFEQVIIRPHLLARLLLVGQDDLRVAVARAARVRVPGSSGHSEGWLWGSRLKEKTRLRVETDKAIIERVKSP